MSDSRIIWKFLSREFTDDSPVIYLYVCGNTRSPVTAVDNAMKILTPIFCPVLSENFVKSVLIGFLDRKKEDYKKGLIKVKPLY
jgi:hypothetical protein